MQQFASPIPHYLDSLLDEVREEKSGHVADYIPELAAADPNPLGIAMCTIGGHIYSAGDCDVPFTLQSISKPFVYALALQERGIDTVMNTVGMEPSGEAFNELSVDDESNLPMNPMINAGAIAVNQLINGEDSTVEDRVEVIRRLMSDLAGRELGFHESLCYSELDHADRNLSIAHMLRSYGVIHDTAHDAVLSYTRQCAIEVTARDLAVMVATLGNGGVQPITGKRVLEPDVCRLTMSVMSSAGMYDAAGRWMARVGIPAKSGVSGGVIGTLPGQLGLATFSPRLDAEGNSVRGVMLFEKLSQQMGLHLMNPMPVGVRAIRSIEVRGDDTVIVIQGIINFSAMESILHEISTRDFSASRLVLDVTHVVSVNRIGRRMLASTLLRLRRAGYEIAIHDPEKRLLGLMLSDGTKPPRLEEKQG
ncbi:glutaminase [Corynebacterium lowii]|uniref:Glutaminase n=1 Tax=Corynebacterium lowii TaxID=1544413 RepID=A0A0Q0Z5M6_9CORY|nr:glutaminase [Corynebacterium lowii]KQB84805.1 Glutaminase [Corynebacterium lowii]MDP9851709.1 glutaminase [Corynebacterium lowii]